MAAKIHRLGHKRESVDTARARRYVARARKVGGPAAARAAMQRASAALQHNAPQGVTHSGRLARPHPPVTQGTRAAGGEQVNASKEWFQTSAKAY